MLFCRPASFLLLSQFYSLFQSTGSHSSTGTVANFPRKRFRTSSLNESVSNECFFPARSRNPSNNLAGTLGHQSETHLGFVLLLFRCCQESSTTVWKGMRFVLLRSPPLCMYTYHHAVRWPVMVRETYVLGAAGDPQIGSFR